MDIQDSNFNYKKKKQDNRVLTGLFFFLIGIALLLNEMSNHFLPPWLFTWPMILILVGIFSGIKCQFRNSGWIFPLFIGLFFLTSEIGLDLNIHRFLIPFLIIFLGVFLILRPRKNRFRSFLEDEFQSDLDRDEPLKKTDFSVGGSEEDYFHSTCIFSGIKKVILSKVFRGADITCIFGGCELDFSNADMKDLAEINLTFLFGGGKIVIPSDWQVRNNLVPIFGGIDDKRNQNLPTNQSKTLVLEGTCIFGGLEIRNFSGSQGYGMNY